MHALPRPAQLNRARRAAFAALALPVIVMSACGSTSPVMTSPQPATQSSIANAAAAAGLQASECQGGLYLWVRSPWEDTMAFTAALAERRAVVVPGVAFGVPDHFRICFSVERPALQVAAQALVEAAASRET